MENLNKVQLTGEIQSEIRENHEWKSEKFYMFELGVKRKSGVIDKARIMVSERLIDLNNLMLGTVINIEGEIRTYNQHDAGTLIRLKGRLQSREYQKREDIGSDHYRTAYEISSYWMTVLGDSETTEK